jgi:ATP-dependent Clp protease ATP-binding subunit ClpC
MNGGMFEKYSDQARRVLFFARHEASVLASREIEPHHLLLGVLKEPDPLIEQLVRLRSTVQVPAAVQLWRTRRSSTTPD